VETWDAIRSRRNVREFASRPVADSRIDQILEAGRRSPSARNWQPWDFILVTDRDQLTELSMVAPGAGHVAGATVAIALVSPVPADDRERNLLRFDLGQATMSIMLAAADLGIGSGHAGVGDQDLARKALGFPDGKFCPYLISLGYPADRPLRPVQRPARRPFDEVVHRGHW
jgi:nitroreductase